MTMQEHRLDCLITLRHVIRQIHARIVKAYDPYSNASEAYKDARFEWKYGKK